MRSDRRMSYIAAVVAVITLGFGDFVWRRWWWWCWWVRHGRQGSLDFGGVDRAAGS